MQLATFGERYSIQFSLQYHAIKTKLLTVSHLKQGNRRTCSCKCLLCHYVHSTNVHALYNIKQFHKDLNFSLSINSATIFTAQVNDIIYKFLHSLRLLTKQRTSLPDILLLSGITTD